MSKTTKKRKASRVVDEHYGGSSVAAEHEDGSDRAANVKDTSRVS